VLIQQQLIFANASRILHLSLHLSLVEVELVTHCLLKDTGRQWNQCFEDQPLLELPHAMGL
jgi:hypothetical protein